MVFITCCTDMDRRQRLSHERLESSFPLLRKVSNGRHHEWVSDAMMNLPQLAKNQIGVHVLHNTFMLWWVMQPDKHDLKSISVRVRVEDTAMSKEIKLTKQVKGCLGKYLLWIKMRHSWVLDFCECFRILHSWELVKEFEEFGDALMDYGAYRDLLKLVGEHSCHSPVDT